MKKRMIDVRDLKIGMYVVEVDRPWLETPFLFQGFPIITQDQIDLAQQICKFVYIDADEEYRPDRAWAGRLPQGAARKVQPPAPSLAERTQAVINSIRRVEPYRVARAFQDELPVAVEVQTRARTTVDQMLDDARLGHSIDSGDARRAVQTMADTVIRNPSALLWLTQLRSRHEYTAIHSLNVCIFLLAFGRHLGLGEAALLDLGLGGLLHDVGKVLIPDEILDKPGRLTEHEMRLMRRHPTYGIGVVQGAREIPRGAVEIIYCHHERVDGSGYPQGLRGAGIPIFGRMAAVVDVYDAVTSDRAYHSGEPSSNVLNRLYHGRQTLFDDQLVEDFIQCVGIYPIGSLVEMSSGEVGIVITVHPQRRLRPTVSLILDAQRMPYFPPRVVNLLHDDDPWAPARRDIVRLLDPGALGIDMHHYLLGEIPPLMPTGLRA